MNHHLYPILQLKVLKCCMYSSSHYSSTHACNYIGQVNRAEPPAVSERKTPKRFMSSIKRLNRVAPFESSPSKTMAMASLQQEAAGDASNMSKPGDASLLDHKLGSSFAEQVLGKVYSNKQAELEVNEPHNSSHVHVDPVVIIKEKPTAQVEGIS